MFIQPLLYLVAVSGCAPKSDDHDCPIGDCEYTSGFYDTETGEVSGSDTVSTSDYHTNNTQTIDTETDPLTDTQADDTGESCPGGEAPIAVDTTDYSALCGGGDRNIFTLHKALLIEDANPTPTITATLAKCDGSPFQSAHECHMRVGSYDGSYDAGLVRADFTWPEGQSTFTIMWSGWPTETDWVADPEGAVKDFYLICDEPDGDWNHWRMEEPASVTKSCP